MVTTPNTVIPNPDPSVVTSDAIDRRVESSYAVLSIRIDEMAKAVQVFHDDLTRVPTQLDKAIDGLRDLIEARLQANEKDRDDIHKKLDERNAAISKEIIHLKDLMFERIEKLSEVTKQQFIGIDSQFAERDTRTDQRAGDTKLAVDAAFAAAKEATAKIEAGFTKSIDEVQRLLGANYKAVDDKLADQKDRITAIESRTVGITSANNGTREVAKDASDRTFSIASIGISIISVIIVAIIGIATIALRH